MQTGTARVRVTYLGRADLEGGDRRRPKPRPKSPSRLPAAPTAKVDTAALGIVPGAAVAPPVDANTPCRRRRRSPPMQVASNQPTGQVTQVPVPAATHLYVQVGAFSKLENAKTLLSKLGGDLRISTLQRNGQTLYRVRTGPLNSVEDADAALSRITGAGSNDAHIVVDQ